MRGVLRKVPNYFFEKTDDFPDLLTLPPCCIQLDSMKIQIVRIVNPIAYKSIIIVRRNKINERENRANSSNSKP